MLIVDRATRSDGFGSCSVGASLTVMQIGGGGGSARLGDDMLPSSPLPCSALGRESPAAADVVVAAASQDLGDAANALVVDVVVAAGQGHDGPGDAGERAVAQVGGLRGAAVRHGRDVDAVVAAGRVADEQRAVRAGDVRGTPRGP